MIFLNKEIGIIDNFIQDNKVSIASKNTLLDEESNVLLDFSNKYKEKNPIYYIAGKSTKKEGFLVIYKYENNEEDVITIEEEKMPSDYYINCILKYENDIFSIDEELSNQIKGKITELCEIILKEQNEELENYRVENHLYKVEEDIEYRIFLHDITSNPDFSIEEVDFPEDLKEYAVEGAVFEYKDGKYVLYSGNDMQLSFFD